MFYRVQKGVKKRRSCGERLRVRRRMRISAAVVPDADGRCRVAAVSCCTAVALLCCCSVAWAGVGCCFAAPAQGCRRRAAAVLCGRLIDQDARHFGAGVEVLRRDARVTPPACAFPSFSRPSSPSPETLWAHAVEGDDEPSVVVGLGDAAVFEKVFYVRSRRDAVRRSDSRSENFDRFDFVAVRPCLSMTGSPGQREAQHGLSFGSPVGRECVVKPRMRRRDPRGGHGEQDRSRAERIGRERGWRRLSQAEMQSAASANAKVVRSRFMLRSEFLQI